MCASNFVPTANPEQHHKVDFAQTVIHNKQRVSAAISLEKQSTKIGMYVVNPPQGDTFVEKAQVGLGGQLGIGAAGAVQGQQWQK